MLWLLSHIFLPQGRLSSPSLELCNLQAPVNLSEANDLTVLSSAFKKIAYQAKDLRITFQRKPTSTRKRGIEVKVKFTLHMENLTIASPEQQHGDQHIDRLTICWISEATEQEVLSMSGKWISSKDFLTQKMTDLKKVGESSLTIEPVEELTTD
jgi:hypothetical protein